ncbi:MAG: hypothetical protein WD407_11900 [Rhodospirillales bacterium]
MAYTLERFSKDCHDALKQDQGTNGLQQVRRHLEAALNDKEFVKTHMGPDNTNPRTILYEDPEFGFCIVAHVHTGPKGGHPHDHGPTWAIYGQAEGTTTMTEWKVVKKGEGKQPSLVEPEKTYELTPGSAVVYPPLTVHSPDRTASTKLIRIEGKNLDHVARNPYKEAAKAA